MKLIVNLKEVQAMMDEYIEDGNIAILNELGSECEVVIED